MHRSLSLLLALTGTAFIAVALAGGHETTEPSGQAVFETSCANCHSGGIGGFFSGAPAIGDADDWETLIPKGLDGLTANTITGIGKMAARGACETCTDADIRAAVEYMLEQSQ
ncbi:MAG: c-type cytochrome [Gammaproteobacteria bacterium]